MVKPIEFKESFLTNRLTNDAMEALTEFIKLKNGAVLCQTEDYVNAKFGSMIIARLFGIFLLHAFKKTLPFRLEAKFYVEHEKLRIDVSLFDNFGWAIRSRLGNSAYEDFFHEIMKEIKNSVV